MGLNDSSRARLSLVVTAFQPLFGRDRRSSGGIDPAC